MMYRIVSVLLAISDWLLGRGVHACDFMPDWLEPDDYRCACGARPNAHATDHLIEDLKQNGAPGWTPGTPPQQAAPLGGTTAMPTIISRPARALHAGDIIVRDPDPAHGGKPVRWRVASRPTTGVDGVTIVDFWDIDDEPRPGIGHYSSDTPVSVEPVGGAA